MDNEAAASQAILSPSDEHAQQTKLVPNVRLMNLARWAELDALWNEMLISQNGRVMFPTLEVRLDQLDKQAMYHVRLDFVVTDKCHWKYNGSKKWVPVGRGAAHESAAFTHPDSPNTGAFWMTELVSFAKVRLMNKPVNLEESPCGIFLKPMLRYIPRVSIFKVDHDAVSSTPLIAQLFNVAKFVTTTAYQNASVKKIKTATGPTAAPVLDTYDKHALMSGFQQLPGQLRTSKPDLTSASGDSDSDTEEILPAKRRRCAQKIDSIEKERHHNVRMVKRKKQSSSMTSAATSERTDVDSAQELQPTHQSLLHAAGVDCNFVDHHDAKLQSQVTPSGRELLFTPALGPSRLEPVPVAPAIFPWELKSPVYAHHWMSPACLPATPLRTTAAGWMSADSAPSKFTMPSSSPLTFHHPPNSLISASSYAWSSMPHSPYPPSVLPQ